MIRSVRVPDAPIGQRYSVDASNVYREPTGHRMIIHTVRLKGKRGDKFRIELLAVNPPAPSLHYSNDEQFKVTFVTGSSINALHKVMDFELKVDGKVDVDISQVGLAPEGKGLAKLTNYTVLVQRAP